jgi:ATP-binding cassette subfamily B protein
MLSIRHIILGLALLLWCILYTAVIYFFSLYKLKIDLKKSELDTKITAQLADTFTNNTNIKLFANFEKEKKDFRKITTEHYNIRQKSWHLMTYLETFQSTLMFLLEAFMVFISIKLWSEGKLTVGDFTLIQLYIISIFDRLWGMGKQVRMPMK